MADAEPFSVDTLLSLPRLDGLALSPDGSRLVTSVARPDAEGKRFVTALWELDPNGEREPRRLTRSAPGEAGAVFMPDGALLFTSSRPDPAAAKDDPRGEAPALWLLPPSGGEAYLIAAPPGGVDDVAVARSSGTIVLGASTHRRTAGWDQDAEREKARVDAGVQAQLFTDYPIRYWDHYLGPRERHLYAAPPPSGDTALEVTDLLPDPGRLLDLATFDVMPDGATAVTSRAQDDADVRNRFLSELVTVDVTTGEQRVLASGDFGYESPAGSPDGRWIVAIRAERSTPDRAGDQTLWLVDLATGDGRDLLPGFDLWPNAPVWAPDSSAVHFTADNDGRTRPYRVDLDDQRLTRLATEGVFTALCPSPDGKTVYALRSMVTAPPHPVALDASASDQEPRAFDGAWGAMALPGRVERVVATAEDGTEVSSWLLLPPDAGKRNPAPLALFIHGGPLGSWAGWHWRWNPHVLTAKGYAVLLPDPALSTGYGLDYIQRGWGRWGDVVYGDLMAAVDETVKRPDIDETRTAAMGGSFGGYMANWIATHTDRFDAIVTHASLWHLDGFSGATDASYYWEKEFGDPLTHPERYDANSPHKFADDIATPMLVIHGDKDYRVPIGEGLRLWYDLRKRGIESKFLYFPDENHWVLTPGNAAVWYETVFAFLAQHVLRQPWQRPDLL